MNLKLLANEFIRSHINYLTRWFTEHFLARGDCFLHEVRLTDFNPFLGRGAVTKARIDILSLHDR